MPSVTARDIDLAVEQLIETLARQNNCSAANIPIMRNSRAAELGAFQHVHLEHAIRARPSARVATLRFGLLAASLSALARALSISLSSASASAAPSDSRPITFILTVTIIVLLMWFAVAARSEGILRRQILYYAEGVGSQSHQQVVAEALGDWERAGASPRARLEVESSLPVLGVIGYIPPRRGALSRMVRVLAHYMTGGAVVRGLYQRLTESHSALEWLVQVLVPVTLGAAAVVCGYQGCGGWPGVIDLLQLIWSRA